MHKLTHLSTGLMLALASTVPAAPSPRDATPRNGEGLAAFETVTVAPAFELDGAGSNVDSIAFWEAPDPEETLMFVTGKANDLVEVWQYPFRTNELAPLTFPANVNGVAVDQVTDLLYVSDRIVSTFSLPDLKAQSVFGGGIIGVGENNLDLLRHAAGQTWIYVSDDHEVHRFDAVTSQHLGSFAPTVSSIETVLADDLHQVILVPEEQGPAGNPGIYAYHPDGTPFDRNGTNRFGNAGEFDSDEEGAALYTFPAHGAADNGTGFIVVSDQRSDVTDFEFFDRQTWAHLGTLRLEGVSNTDGIASTQRALPAYPLGLFAAINNDTSTALIGWDAIFTAIGWDIAPEAVRITPSTLGPTTASTIEFTVVFSEPVTGFDDADDLLIAYQGTSSTGVVNAGTGGTYTVTVAGINGLGSLTLAVNTDSDVADLTENRLASSVISAPVRFGTAYHAWAEAEGLLSGVNDGVAEDPDGDTSPNLKEFALDGDPLNHGDVRKDRVAVEHIDGARFLTYTLPARSGAAFAGTTGLSATVDGVVYSLSGSSDLVEFNLGLSELMPARETGLPALQPGWSYHTFRSSEPIHGMSAGFVRLSLAPNAP